MRNFQKTLGLLALASAIWGNGGIAMANTPKLPAAVHDTVFYDDFENLETYSDWQMFDLNEDGNTWEIERGGGAGYSTALQYSGNGTSPYDWVVSKGFSLETGKTYRLSYFYNQLYYNERVEVYIGRESDPASMTKLLSKQEVTTYGRTETEFKMDETGTYHLGFKVTSNAVDRPYLIIDEVSVTEEIAGTTPQPVQNLTQIPGQNGAITMGLSWTNPSKDEAGNSLADLTALEVYKNYGNENIAGNLNLQAGTQVTWIDPNPQPGKVTYHVYAVNASGRSYAASVSTYVGEDLPSAPRNLKVEIMPGKVDEVKLSWDEPDEFGLNGGWYDKSSISYLVARRGSEYTVLDPQSTATTYTETIANMDLYYYEVSARNAFGQGGKVVSDPAKIGSSMPMPFSEGFDDPASMQNLWTINDADRNKATWDFNSSKGNLNPGCAYWNWIPGVENIYEDDIIPPADDWLFTPLMQFEAGKTYRLSYSVAGPKMGTISLRIMVGKEASPESMISPIEDLYLGTGGPDDFEDRSIEFESPGEGALCLGFYYYGYYGNGYIYLDDIRIEEVTDNDLAAIRIKGFSSPKTGEKKHLCSGSGKQRVFACPQFQSPALGRCRQHPCRWPGADQASGIRPFRRIFVRVDSGQHRPVLHLCQSALE